MPLLCALRDSHSGAPADDCCDEVPFCLPAGVSQIDRVVEAVEETLKGNVVHMLAKKKLPKLDLPKVATLLPTRLSFRWLRLHISSISVAEWCCT
jgi:hypothetical protein